MELLKKWLGHPKELYNLVRFKMGGYKTVMLKMDQDSLSDSLCLCYRYLNQTSRSYAAVIQMLDGELRHAACIFYLIIRAVDTVEDDMTINLETKIPMLQNFHSYLYQPDWRFMDSNEKHKQVLENFQMYCYYVAGQVLVGLSQFFSATKLEDPIVGQDTELANSMGLFLQKTNIIRDYLEDQLEGRDLWPQEVWSKYAKKMSDLAKPENTDKAVQCLNELITNALHHIPDVLTYLSRLKNQSVFNFCAIPQVMAIATLAACYNNQQVFRGVVKIRKGQAVTLMMDATNIQAVKAIMYQYVEEIYQKIPSTDPSASRMQQIITSIRSMTLPGGALVSRTHYSPIYLSCMMLLTALSWQYLSMMSKVAEEYIHTGEN
ncbi:squalene synthase-like isoform X2 [Sceloporus undulatus]|uniref:squalene synthase-like isoform X2 n=1 Tax=Sceloporus undulatus TaxID=8520 RepID=UPI001C4D8766|nr:squalene synthase-like isoform X2 [Sceloporus undulatus]